MTRVVAPSRLHFGLLTGSAERGRRFGGCGLMIDSPGVSVAVELSARWHAEGPCGERALAFARQVTDEPHRIIVERCPAEHTGLGVGTSLGLSVAKAIRPDRPTAELARLVGRGQRSGVGLHGFDLGGFVIDCGKRTDDELPRLTTHLPFPAEWRVALFVPDQPAVWYGAAEQKAFARLGETPTAERSGRRMEELLDREIGPAIRAKDHERFALAVGEYNRLAGEPFAAEQGGTYAGRVVAALVAAIADLGHPGIGQSSWGPTVFAICPDPDSAVQLTDAIRTRFAGLRTGQVVTPATRGATVESTPSG